MNKSLLLIIISYTYLLIYYRVLGYSLLGYSELGVPMIYDALQPTVSCHNP